MFWNIMSCWCNIHVYFSKVSHIYGFIMNLFRIIWYILVYMTYIDNFSIQQIDNLSICCMDKNFCPYNIWKKLYICCMDIKFFSYNIWTSCLYVVWENLFIHKPYRQIFHMLYGQLHYHCAFFRTDWINSIIPCFIKLI